LLYKREKIGYFDKKEKIWMAFQNKMLMRILKFQEKMAYGILHVINSKGMLLGRICYEHKEKRNADTLSTEGFTVRGHLGEQGVEELKISAYSPVILVAIKYFKRSSKVVLYGVCLYTAD
jgi:hypothetical protein